MKNNESQSLAGLTTALNIAGVSLFMGYLFFL